MDFGFSISKSSSVELDKVDTTLYDKLVRDDKGVATCISCGSCTATCTAGPFSGMSVRKVILGLQRGVDVRPMLSCCMLCGKCTMVCPRGINTRNLILNISKLYD